MVFITASVPRAAAEAKTGLFRLMLGNTRPPPDPKQKLRPTKSRTPELAKIVRQSNPANKAAAPDADPILVPSL